MPKHFLVVMDLKGAEQMPRGFYYHLDKARKDQPITRIQQSCYECTGVQALTVLRALGEKYGFEVKVYEVQERD